MSPRVPSRAPSVRTGVLFELLCPKLAFALPLVVTMLRTSPTGQWRDDMPVVRAIVKSSAADDYRFSSLVRGIVTSVPFQMRRAE